VVKAYVVASNVSTTANMDYESIVFDKTNQPGFLVVTLGAGRTGGRLGRIRFDADDVILGVGGLKVQANSDLDDMINTAVNNGRRFVTVENMRTKQIENFDF
jgi:hypothetical protein